MRRVIITLEDVTPEVIQRGSMNIPTGALITPLVKDLIVTYDLKINHV